MELLERCIVVAAEAHAGQKDRQGRPYILHPLTVMLQMATDEEMMAAVLHDVIEDTEVTQADLRALGVPDRVLAAIDLLTKREDEPSYEAYIRRIKRDKLAIKIKLADLAHNMDVRRLDSVSDDDAERLARYLNAWRQLTAAE